jgi:outer membrane protein OmpA-like peptidoglycan-associated protein
MSDGQKTFLFSAAFVVVIAIGGVTLWKVVTGPTKHELAALNAKIEATNTALAQVQKATASKAMTQGLAELQDNIKSTNKALADIQRTIAAGNVRDRLDTLEKSVKGIDASLASLQKSQAAADLGGKVAAVESEVKALSGQTASLNGVANQISPLNDKIKSLNDTLADIQKSTSLDGVKTQLTALSNKLESTNKAVGNEAVVFYLHMPNSENLPQKVASISPLDIQFEKVGSTDDNGRAAVIIPKLKALVEGRTGCTISVAGYADTLGNDKVNLKISQKRAQNIAQKIKDAFSGGKVQVNVAAWGERRLQKWTPDAIADEANRRVDIAVNCKS